MTSSQQQLQEERAALAKRCEDSQAEVAALRAQLQAHQDTLSQLEAEGEGLKAKHEQVSQLMSDALSKRELVGPELTERLVGPLREELAGVERAISSHQARLQDAHEHAATIAQQLGPAFQKQRRFEEALASIDAMFTQEANAPAAPVTSAAPVTPAAPIAPAAPVAPAAPAKASDEARQVRVPLRTSVRFELNVDAVSDHNFYTGFTDNISEGGLFIATDQHINLDTELTFHLNLPTLTGTHELKGVVRWVRHSDEPEPGSPNGVGVQFISLTQELKSGIERFIAQRESIFYDD
jgi:uncharacterized protein (TIGR02266 family)